LYRSEGWSCRQTIRKSLRPQKLEAPSHDFGTASALSGHVINDAVLLKTIGSSFIAAHSGANLVTADRILRSVCHCLRSLSERVGEGAHCFAVGAFAIPCLGFSDEASWQVGNPATVLMLVAMLSSSAAARVPINPEITGAPEIASKMSRLAENGDSYR
jgi:hypothetical protein